MKTCCRCKEDKPFIEFSIAKSNKDNLNHKCKVCIAELTRIYIKTEQGKITQIYNTQIKSSEQRGHIKPSYTKKELSTWMYKNGYKLLWETWTVNNHSSLLSPSVDRLDDKLPYSISNIRLVTWKENNAKNHKERLNCIKITKQNKKIGQFSLAGEFIAEFASISYAARTLNICRTQLNKACKTPPYKTGGFMWQYL